MLARLHRRNLTDRKTAMSASSRPELEPRHPSCQQGGGPAATRARSVHRIERRPQTLAPWPTSSADVDLRRCGFCHTQPGRPPMLISTATSGDRNPLLLYDGRRAADGGAAMSKQTRPAAWCTTDRHPRLRPPWARAPTWALQKLRLRLPADLNEVSCAPTASMRRTPPGSTPLPSPPGRHMPRAWDRGGRNMATDGGSTHVAEERLQAPVKQSLNENPS